MTIGGLDTHTFLTFYVADGLAGAAAFAVVHFARRRGARSRAGAAAHRRFEQRRDAALARAAGDPGEQDASALASGAVR